MFLSMAIRAGKRKGIQLNKLFRTVFGNHWIEVAARWILGVTFVYASYNKILSPAVFAKIIYGYDLFPAVLINLIAIIVPFLELFSGLALIVGIYPRSATLIINGMLLAFIISLSINLIRGHEFNCGCFSIYSSGQGTFTGLLIFRDFVLFALGLYIFFYRNARKLCILNFRLSQ
jgi:putative oxidoreductase